VTTFWMLLWLAFAPDLTAVKAEPDPDRRSELALANADQGIDSARDALTKGDIKTVETSLGEVRQAVELSYESLHQSREKPRHSKFYKRAELKILALLRRLNTLRDDLEADNREPADAVISRLRQLHDELLTDIMSKRKP
jgi:hypothetical protein